MKESHAFIDTGNITQTCKTYFLQTFYSKLIELPVILFDQASSSLIFPEVHKGASTIITVEMHVVQNIEK